MGEANGQPGDSPAAPAYFQRRLPVALILGAFFALTVPLCLGAVCEEDFLVRNPIAWLYVTALGTSHFVLTFTVYLQQGNRRHFASTPANRLRFILAPLAILVALDFYHVARVALLFPALDLAFRLGVRFLDFQHLCRQDYGVSQLFKGRSRCRFPAWMRGAESVYFFTLTLLLFQTFLSGGSFRVSGAADLVLPALAAGLGCAVLAGYALGWARSGRSAAVLTPLAYFLAQSASAALAAYWTPFYSFCLATHYVEYHVLMAPRCFRAELDERCKADRALAWLRSSKVVFYGLLFLASAAVTKLTWLSLGSMTGASAVTPSGGYLMLISLFDGIFITHYFLEALIWRFGDPYFRQTLSPLYFGPPRAATPARPREGLAMTG